MTNVRRLNGSVAFRAVQELKLERTPTCEQCGGPAREMHLEGGCRVNPPYDAEEAIAVCRECHDATGCPEHVDGPLISRLLAIRLGR